MQIPITLENKLIYIKKTSDPFGMNVPFETSSYREDFEQSMSGGFFDLSDWGIVEIKGPDARDFLQRMTTVDFKKISSHKVVPGAFLTGRGGVVALGMFRMLKDEHFLFITGPGQESASLDHIDRFHFQEKLEAQTAGQDSVVLGLWATPEQLEKKLGWKLGAALEVTQSTLDSVGVETWIDNRRPFLVWCQLQRNNALAFITALSKKGFDLLGTHVFHFYRIQAGMPWMGWEITDKDLILEANLEDHVARNKGCYPGQEVVERIFTYGQVNRKLFVVELKTQESRDYLRKPVLVDDGDKRVGELVSAVEFPEDSSRAIGLAYIRKGYWNSSTEYETADKDMLKIQLGPERNDNA